MDFDIPVPRVTRRPKRPKKKIRSYKKLKIKKRASKNQKYFFGGPGAVCLASAWQK